jgi:hypothetical protein
VSKISLRDAAVPAGIAIISPMDKLTVESWGSCYSQLELLSVLQE